MLTDVAELKISCSKICWAKFLVHYSVVILADYLEQDNAIEFVLNSEGCSYVFRASSVKMCKMGINCCTLQNLVNFIWDSEINQVRSQNDNREHYKFYNFCKFLNTLFFTIYFFSRFFFVEITNTPNNKQAAIQLYKTTWVNAHILSLRYFVCRYINISTSTTSVNVHDQIF